MIFVTVGTQKFPFNRLVRKMDEIAARHITDESIIMQIGRSTYVPQHCTKYSRYFNYEDMEQYISECSLLITHSGVGTVMKAAMLGKKVIVVPRLKEFHEHVDDNQLEIADVLKKKRMAQVCIDIDSLDEMVINVLHEKNGTRPYVQSENRLERYIINYIEHLPEGKS